jgi:hypothetical protein
MGVYHELPAVSEKQKQERSVWSNKGNIEKNPGEVFQIKSSASCQIAQAHSLIKKKIIY